MDEQFSAFLDNETTRDEGDAVINALLHDEALRDSWTRQHHIREVLRASADDMVAGADTDFSTRVMQAIHDESGTTSPATASIEPAEAGSPKVVPIGSTRRRKRRWQNMAGLAVAASAAGVAFFVMQPAQQLTTTGQPQPAVVQQATNTGPTTLAAAETEPSTQLHFATTTAAKTGYETPWDWAGGLVRTVASRMDQSADRWAVSDPNLANRLNDLLMEHNGLARGYGLGATTPGFVRVAAYGQGSVQ